MIAIGDLSSGAATRHLPDGREIVDGPLCHGVNGFKCNADNIDSYGVITAARIRANPAAFVICDAPKRRLVSVIDKQPVGKSCEGSSTIY